MKPYDRGQSVFLEGEIIDLKELDSVEIVSTVEKKDNVFDRMSNEQTERDRRNSGSGVLVTSTQPSDTDLTEAGTNVTNQYISKPLGSKPGLWMRLKTVTAHPVIAGVIGLLIGAAITAVGSAMFSWWATDDDRLAVQQPPSNESEPATAQD